MKTNKLMSVGVLALFALVASTMSAVPICDTLVGTGINVTVLNNGGTGCIENGLLFNNFQVISASMGVGLAEIDVVQGGITVSGNTVNFAFNPNLGVGTSGGTLTDLHFAFTVQGSVGGASMTVGGTNASVNETNCTVASGINGGCLNPNRAWDTLDLSGQATSCQGNTASGNGTNAMCAYGNGFPEIWVFKDISIGDPTMSHLTTLSEGFSGVGVPEPVTMSLMGLGLVGIGLLGRRLRK